MTVFTQSYPLASRVQDRVSEPKGQTNVDHRVQRWAAEVRPGGGTLLVGS